MDSLRKLKVDTFFVFLTLKKNHPVTYFLWLKDGSAEALRITDSTISNVHEIFEHFIKKMDLKNLAVRESEDKLRFKPPIDPAQSDLVLINISNKSYIIEYGRNPHYQLDPDRNKIRKDFIGSIKSDLKLVSGKWKSNRKYFRYAE
jgi:hypothetical protein